MLFVAGLALAVGLHVADPSEATAFPVCPFYAITGLYCPGCGTLRCLHALLHADVRAAVDYNILTAVFAPMLVLAWLSVGLAGLRGRQVPLEWRAPRWTAWAVGMAFGLFWIVRNLSLGPFSWMAP